MVIHGIQKIDVWLWFDPQNAEKVIDAIRQFGFGSLDLQAEDFLVVDQIIQLGYPPNRIDLLTSLPGVNFEDCYPDRVTTEIDGVNVNFIDLENLKTNKQASGRAQDLADLDNLP